MNCIYTNSSGNRRTIKDIISVTVSNIIKLFAGVLVGFVLPKIIGVDDYGYYKTFTLYSTYVGLFTFGFMDGIYLNYGGLEYNKLSKEKFRLYSRILISSELFVAVIFLVVSVVFLKGEYSYIFAFLSIYLLFTNITGYFQIVSQISFRFKELSTRNVIQSALIAIQVLVLLVLSKVTQTHFSYHSYIAVYVCIIGFLAIWYIFTYRDITFGKAINLRTDSKFLGKLLIDGFPLMLSNLCSSLILTLDRQFVSVLYDITTYAKYAFAYNMLSLVTTSSSAISLVLYPKLKQYSRDKLIGSYTQLVTYVMLFMFGCMMLYFPLVFIVSWYLPKYLDSLDVFRVIFPGLAISSVITIVIHNYYKFFKDTFNYFLKTVVILVVSCFTNLVAYLIFRTTISISVASIITMILWYLLTDNYLHKKYRIKRGTGLFYMLIMMSIFYLCTLVNNVWLSFLIYLLSYCLISLAFYGKTIKQIANQLHNHRNIKN